MNSMKAAGFGPVPLSNMVPQLSIPPMIHTNPSVIPVPYTTIPRQSYNISPLTPHPSTPMQTPSPFPFIDCSAASNMVDGSLFSSYSPISFAHVHRQMSNLTPASGIGIETPTDLNSNIEEIPFWTWFYSSKLSPQQQNSSGHVPGEPSKPGIASVSKSSDIYHLTNSAASTCQSPSESLGLGMSPVVMNPLYYDSACQTDLTSVEYHTLPSHSCSSSCEGEKVEIQNQCTDTEDLPHVIHTSSCHRGTQTDTLSNMSSPLPYSIEECSDVVSTEQENHTELSCQGVSDLYLATRLHAVESRLQELNVELDQIACEHVANHHYLLKQHSMPMCLDTSQCNTASCSPISLPSPSSVSCGQEIIDEIMAVTDNERHLLSLMSRVQGHYSALKNKLRRCKRGEWLKDAADHYVELLACRHQADQLLETFTNPTTNALSFLSVVATEVDEGRLQAMQQTTNPLTTSILKTSDLWKGDHKLVRGKIRRRQLSLHVNSKKRQTTARCIEGPTPSKQAKIGLSRTSHENQQPSFAKTTVSVNSKIEEDRGSPRPPTPDLRRCDLDITDLSCGIPILLVEGSYLRPGVIVNVAPSDAADTKTVPPKAVADSLDENSSHPRPLWNQKKWLVQLESDRKPLRCLPAYELLSQAVLEVRPSSVRHLPPGTRVCAHWSRQLADKLYPGTVVEDNSLDNSTDQVAIAFDDNDFRHVPLHQVRMLPEKFDQLSVPVDGSEMYPLPVSSPNYNLPQALETVEDRTNSFQHDCVSLHSGSVTSVNKGPRSIFCEVKKATNSPAKSTPSKTKVKRQTSSLSKSKVSDLSTFTSLENHQSQESPAITSTSELLQASSDHKEPQARWNVMWSPVGEIIKSTKCGNFYRSAKRLVDGHTIRIGNAVQMIGGEDEVGNEAATSISTAIPIYIGRVMEIFQDKTVDPSSVDAVKVNVQWYYTPEEALACCPQEELLLHLPEGALFQSDHPDVNEARTIIRCVKIAPQYSKLNATLSDSSEDSSTSDTETGSSITEDMRSTDHDRMEIQKKVSHGKYFLAGRIRVFPEKKKPAIIIWNREMLQLGKADRP